MSTATKRFNVMHFESKGFRKLMVFPQEKITPELAKDLLLLNTNNRPLKNATLNRYVHDMENDNWVYTGGTININKEGKLQNGQHRLLAIVKTGKPQMFNIQCGLEEIAFEYMDIGKNRTASDALAVKGFRNHGTIASIAKFNMLYKSGMLKEMCIGGNAIRNITIHDIVNWVENEDNELLQECAVAGGKYGTKFKVLTAPTYASFLYIFSKLNREDAFGFFDMVVSGENISLKSFSMIYLLRQRLINFSTGGTQLRTKDKYALIIKAWNAFRKGKEVKQLSWNGNTEDFPTAI